MNGSAASPELGSFLAQSDERIDSFLRAAKDKPNAVANVFQKQAATIVENAMKGVRCFTYGVVNEKEEVISAGTHLYSLLRWINEGKLAKDHTFVGYVKNCDPLTQHPIYVTTDKHGSFMSGVVAVPSTASLLQQLASIKPAQLSPEQAHSFKTACTYPHCGARDKPLHKCGKCKKACYCSKVCQIAHWPVHKMYCGK